MHIDRHNFLNNLQEVLCNIQKSDFISFDCEFSGLVASIDRIQGIFPNQQQFYERIKQTANNFVLFQIGISAFIYQNEKYTPKAYNFYLDPKMRLSQGYNNVILCQVQSIEFLAKNGMDFNRIFTQGIKSQRINTHIQTKNQHLNVPTKFSYQSMHFDEMDKKIVSEIEISLKGVIDDETKEILIDFKTKSILIYFRNKYSNLFIQQRSKAMKPNQFYVRKCIEYQESQIKFEKDMIDQKQENQNKIQHHGFQIVIKKIIETKKPMIGHFPNLDIGLMFNAFIEPLPHSFKEFCEKINSIFPFIFDTKVISRRIQSKLKSLKVDLPSLFKACFNEKLLKSYSNINFTANQKYLKSQNYHEAGYDAFITGCSFIGMANYILQQKDQRLNFMNLQSENKVLYSRFTGEVSLKGPNYCPNAITYDQTIIIGEKQPNDEQEKIAKILSKFGTLSIYQDHGQIYYVFEKQQNIEQILSMYPGLKLMKYCERTIIRASSILTSKDLKVQ